LAACPKSVAAAAKVVNTHFSVDLFEQVPILGILRGLPPCKIEPVVAAVCGGGLTNLEITMNTPGAADQIRLACAGAGGALNIGAGTVTSLPLLEEALAAGASFIVTPTVTNAVIRRCVHLNVPVFPGALSPGEILTAWNLGATLVKVFPAGLFGPAYIRCLKEELPEIRLMPTGGVNLDTFSSYASAGADAFGVGTPLFNAARIAYEDWAWLRGQCQAFVNGWRQFRCKS
jgi:2-dehydro-3-deoxyphosphogluconate aldolase/(4S)-4-hydroxy-2-oxoglutarate aldolase